MYVFLYINLFLFVLPHNKAAMELKVKDVVRFFNVPENTIYEWIETRGFPACKVMGQFRFNREELLEWATTTGTRTSARFFPDNCAQQERADIGSALETGGIFYLVKGQNKQEVLRNVVGLLRLPEKLDREFLLQMLLAREALASTGIGQGIAIPHTRNPIVLAVDKPMVSLLFLEKPVEFGAVDGRPVHTLFTLVSPTIRVHLNILSRIAYVLHDAAFRRMLEERAKVLDIAQQIRRIEDSLGTQP